MRLLNVGCGMDQRGTDFLDIAKHHEKVVICNVDKDRFPYSNETFEMIYAFHVIEHLTNTRHFMTECWRVLKYQGKMLLVTDNASFLPYHMPFKGSGAHDGYNSNDSNDKHFHIHTKQDIINLSSTFMFNVEQCGYCYNESVFGLAAPIPSIVQGLCYGIPALWFPKYFETQIFAKLRKGPGDEE